MRRLSNTDGLTNMQNVANVKLRHVLTELLETERIYVNEISTILKVPARIHPNLNNEDNSFKMFIVFFFEIRVTEISWSILNHIRKFRCSWLRKLTFYSAICRRLALSTGRFFFRTLRVALPAPSSLQPVSYDTYAFILILKKKKFSTVQFKSLRNMKHYRK